MKRLTAMGLANRLSKKLPTDALALSPQYPDKKTAQFDVAMLGARDGDGRLFRVTIREVDR